jgi:hypothetical protein
MACTSSSGPWKNTLTIRLQPVEFDWTRDDDDDELLLPDGRDDEGFDDSPVAVEAVECFKVDGPARDDDGDDLESFELAFVEVLEEL